MRLPHPQLWILCAILLACMAQISAAPIPTSDSTITLGTTGTVSPAAGLRFAREDASPHYEEKRQLAALFRLATSALRMAPAIVKTAAPALAKIVAPVTKIMTSAKGLLSSGSSLLSSGSSLLKSGSAIKTTVSGGSALKSVASSGGSTGILSSLKTGLSSFGTSVKTGLTKVGTTLKTGATAAAPAILSGLASGGMMGPGMMSVDMSTGGQQALDPSCPYQGTGPGAGIDVNSYLQAFAAGISQEDQTRFFQAFCNNPQLSATEFQTLVQGLQSAVIASPQVVQQPQYQQQQTVQQPQQVDQTTQAAHIQPNGDESCPYQGAGTGAMTQDQLQQTATQFQLLSAQDAASYQVQLCNLPALSATEFTTLTQILQAIINKAESS